jgi:chromosome segregation ATPase
MPEPKRRLVDRIVEPDYADALTEKSVEDLRVMRDECREGENELSFERRLCHARIDILNAELDRRAGRTQGDLVDRLPEILGEGRERATEDSPLPSRAPDFSIPRSVDVPRRRIEEIAGEQNLARVAQLSVEEIKETIRSLAELERTLSDRRRRVHDVMDAIQAEIVRRYTSGEADPTAALG